MLLASPDINAADEMLKLEALRIRNDHGQTLPALLSGIGGLSPNTLQLAMSCVIGLAILIFVLKDKRFRKSLDNNLAGLIVGLLVIGGWYITGHPGFGCTVRSSLRW